MLLTLAANYYYNQQRKAQKKPQNNGDNNSAVTGITLAMVLTIFVIEFLFMIMAIYMAARCGVNHDQLFLNILAALFFPVIYVIYALISGCYKQGKSRR